MKSGMGCHDRQSRTPGPTQRARRPGQEKEGCRRGSGSEIKEAVSTFGASFAKQHGPASLEQDITRSIARGDMPDAIKTNLMERMVARLTPFVGANVDEVANRILEQAISKAQGRVAAAARWR